jgi:hypothetical protein
MMGARDEISKAAENAMEDLAGTSEQSDDGHVPEPGKPGEPIKVNSSVSEATNASEAEREDPAAGVSPVERTSNEKDDGSPQPPSAGPDSPDADPGREGAMARAAGGGVAGPAGLPEPDPQSGTSGPLESDEDPSTDMGRG